MLTKSLITSITVSIVVLTASKAALNTFLAVSEVANKADIPVPTAATAITVPATGASKVPIAVTATPIAPTYAAPIRDTRVPMATKTGVGTAVSNASPKLLPASLATRKAVLMSLILSATDFKISLTPRESVI